MTDTSSAQMNSYQPDFTVEIGLDRMRIHEVGWLQKPAKGLIAAGLTLFIFFWMVMKTLPWRGFTDSLSGVVLIGFWLVLIWGMLRRENASADRTHISLSSSYLGRQGKERIFNIADVTNLRYGIVSYSRYRAISGLRFEAKGKKIRFLRDLKPIEAEKILETLREWGFNVRLDNDFQIALNEDKYRRNSKDSR